MTRGPRKSPRLRFPRLVAVPFLQLLGYRRPTPAPAIVRFGLRGCAREGRVGMANRYVWVLAMFLGWSMVWVTKDVEKVGTPLCTGPLQQRTSSLNA